MNDNQLKQLNLAVVAHVDSGKTTLSESLLYESGSIRKLGRVDHKDAYLDTYTLEKARGITIFSKQAMFKYNNTTFTLLDTPGHVDFSAEMERTLQVLDYAILIVSGSDGVQGHTKTLWKLLKKYRIPVFLFINKMEQNSANKHTVLTQLRTLFSEECIDFTEQNTNEFYESIATSDEKILEQFLETNRIEIEDIKRLIIERKIFPCFFGSALKMQGIKEFLEGLVEYTCEREYPEEFGARVFKIQRDDSGNRLTYLKVTGGSLKVKDTIYEKEKVNQIRIYSGSKYQTVSEAPAGTICTVTGLTKTKPGEGLGYEQETITPILAPVLTYQLLLPDGIDPAQILPKLQQLEEEIPELHIVWNELLQSIHVQIMGEVQTEILKVLIQERFGVDISLGQSSIVYKETIQNTVEGVGHFEPLRHYAEVHLLMEPLEMGAGLQFECDCDEELLAKNWQRLIMTHLLEREHKGVLTGSPITDMRITLIAGRAHQKHTEGGDFRQATYRAVRQGLMCAESRLLEPYYDVRLEVPESCVGRVMIDMDKMYGTCALQESKDGFAVITGSAPVIAIQEYPKEVTSFTKGQGKVSFSFKGYGFCHNSEEVLEEMQYDPESDLNHPSCSVFCSHGSGFIVNWDQVYEYMHVPSPLIQNNKQDLNYTINEPRRRDEWIDTDEIDRILEQTYYSNRKGSQHTVGYKLKRKQVDHNQPIVRSYSNTPAKEDYLLVDGYNVIYANAELKELAEANLDAACNKLMDILCDYQGMRGCRLILVFDAYRVVGHQTEIIPYHNIKVVYTKEAETADQYIEKFAHENCKKYNIIVATSDGVEQIIIRSKGCGLLSARDLWEEIKYMKNETIKTYVEQQDSSKYYLFDQVSSEIKETIEEIRDGKMNQ